MSKQHNNKTDGSPAAGKKFPVSILVILVLTAVLITVWLNQDKTAAPAQATKAAETNTSQESAANMKPAANPAFQRLVGRWLRPDGGYVLEIKRVDAAGKMEAGYFNPSPINVSRAEASLVGSVTKVFVELRDVNYPGSTYTLLHDATTDQLKGIYFQATMKQEFEVFFERLK